VGAFRLAAIRILIVYVTAGAGHRRAAEAIAQAAERALPSATVECRDLLDEVPAWLRRAYPATYYLLVRHFPWCWAWSFALLDRQPLYGLIQPLRRLWNDWAARRFTRALRADPPDLIVTTHFFPADVVSACKRRGGLPSPLVVVVTDLQPHRFWLGPADRIVVGTEEGFKAAVRRGAAADRLRVLGIPTAHGFRDTFDPATLQRQFGLAPERRTVLVTGGGSPVGPFEAVVEALRGLEDAMPGRLQLLVVCGYDAAVRQRVSERVRGSRMPVTVLGFIETMAQAMAVSHLIVTKAGGVTVTEALARGLPLVLYHVIPGQEQLNARYVVEHGAALLELQPLRLAQAVQRLFEQPERLEQMRVAAGALSHPDTAATIVSQVMQPLLTQARQP